jgi:hypothetical protein
MRSPAFAHPLALALVAALSIGAAWPGAAPARAAATQDPGLAVGIRQVDEGDFEGAVATLGPVADRLSAKGGRDAAQACLYLGIAELALDQGDAARARFREALGHEPSLRLGPDRFSPKVIAAFEDALREREAEARAAAPAVGAEAGRPQGRTILLAERRPWPEWDPTLSARATRTLPEGGSSSRARASPWCSTARTARRGRRSPSPSI